MAKIITFDDEQRNEIREAFEKALANYKATNGTFSFTKSFSSIDRKATIKFSEMAWLKMWALIREHNLEVGWYGLTRRSETVEDEYEIYDILVYPQIRTAATIDQDQDECNKWSIDLCKRDREAYRNMHMHGHSHVNMGVTPSTTDETFYKQIIGQKCDTFWIFMIWNKRGEKTIKIYDFAKNILFETADCTIKISNDHLGVEDFLEAAQAVIKDHSYTTKPKEDSAINTNSNYKSYSNYKNYWSESSGTTTPTTPAKAQEEKPATNQLALPSQKSGRRKGRRAKKKNTYSSWTGYNYAGASVYDNMDDDW